MKLLVPIILILTVSAIFPACRKSSDLPAPPSVTPGYIGPYLYVGGGTLNSRGIYWKSQLIKPVPVADTLVNALNITAIATSANAVYMAGEAGGYWKNDSFIAIPNAFNIQFLSLTGSAIYTAGYDKSANLAYWVNNSEISLEKTFDRNLFPYEGILSYGLSGITGSGSDVYVTGILSFENEPYSPDTAVQGNFGMLWKNGGLHLLGPGVLLSAVYKSTAGVVVVDSNVYIAGQYPDTTFAGGYWKNGIWTPINNGSFTPSSIAAIGGKVYIPGYTYIRAPGSFTQRAAYWVDGTLVPLDGLVAYAVTSHDSDIYVLGVDPKGNIVVWKNSTVFEMIGPGATLIATSIAIE
jgi:hypothetical protein